MKTRIPLFLLLLFPALILRAETPADPLAEADRLRDQGLYESAWTQLHAHAEEIPFSELMIRKTELCLRYYAVTNLHKAFAFRDLAPGETLAALRRKQPSMENMKLFDPAGALQSALEQDPENGALRYWLGEYYFSLSALFGPESGLSREELDERILRHYGRALAMGEADEALYANLAYTELTRQNWSSAAAHYLSAQKENPRNAGYHHNRALALMRQNKAAEADEEVREALALDAPPSQRGDTLFLGSTIALGREDEQDARRYLEEGMRLAPRDYRFPDRLIRLHLVRKDFPAALKAAEALFALYPENPASCQTPMGYFNDFGALSRFAPFFEELIPRYRDSPAARGNLLYHQGVLSQLTGNPARARSQLEEARRSLEPVFPEDHEIFRVIAGLLEELSP